MAGVPHDPSELPTATLATAPESGPGGAATAAATVVASPARRAAWGPWASIGWTILATVLIAATQLVTAIAYLVVRKVVNPRGELADLTSDGVYLALATLATLPVVTLLVGVLVGVRGWRARDYLAFRPGSVRAVVLATSGLILWLAASDGLTIALDRPIVPPFLTEAIFQTPLWLLALAVVVAAPLTEEILFRGFLFRGLADSPRFGPGLAIGLTAIAWATLHVQYDLYGIATVYMTGLYLGTVRHYSGSLVLTIFLHGVANTIATAEAVLLTG